jgi:hypothetical protein
MVNFSCSPLQKVDGERWAVFSGLSVGSCEIEILFPTVRACLRPVSGTPRRSWDVVYTARLSAACLVALTSYFPTCQARSFRGRTRYAEAFLGHKNQRSFCYLCMPKPNALAYPIFPFWRDYVDGDRRTEAGSQSVTTTYLLI